MILLVENSRKHEKPLLKQNVELICLKYSDVNVQTMDECTSDTSAIDAVLLGNCDGHMHNVATICKMFDVPVIAVLENRSMESLIDLYLHGVDEVILMDNFIEEFLNYRHMMTNSH